MRDESQWMSTRPCKDNHGNWRCCEVIFSEYEGHAYALHREISHSEPRYGTQNERQSIAESTRVPPKLQPVQESRVQNERTGNAKPVKASQQMQLLQNGKRVWAIENVDENGEKRFPCPLCHLKPKPGDIVKHMRVNHRAQASVEGPCLVEATILASGPVVGEMRPSTTDDSPSSGKRRRLLPTHTSSKEG